MAGDLITGPYQIQVRDIVMGRGAAWKLMPPVTGFGLPSLRTSDTDRPLDHGEFEGLDLMKGRTLTGSARISVSDDVQAHQHERNIVAAFVPSTELETLAWSLPDGSVVLAYGRPRRCVTDLGGLARGVVEATWQFKAHDPRWYSQTEHSLSLSPPVASEGRTYPRTYPLAYGAGSSGVETAVNAGNFGTRPVWTLHGPLTNPELENVTTGRSLELAIVLSGGDTLVVDFDDRTVLLDGTASRYSSIVDADWWELAPGDNDLRLSVTAGSGTADVAWRDAWV